MCMYWRYQRRHQDVEEIYLVGFCQPSFYSVGFKGTCRECPALCLNCRDKQGFEMRSSLDLGIENDMYCMQ